MILKKFRVLLHTLSAYNSLLARYKVYSSDPREWLCKQAVGMVKPMKTLDTRRKLHGNKSVTAKVCLVWSLLLGKNYTEIKS